MTRSARMLLPTLRRALERMPDAGALRTVLVDLTPGLGQPANGMKSESIRLWLRALCNHQKQWNWVLLTNPVNHEEFEALETSHVRRHCLLPRRVAPRPARMGRKRRWAERIGRVIAKVFGSRRPPLWPEIDTLAQVLQAELLFCPYGITNYQRLPLPSVAVWRGVPARQEGRVGPSVWMADRLVCFSDRVRKELVAGTGGDSKCVVRLPSLPWEQPPQVSEGAVEALLTRHRLQHGKYFLYDADFAEAQNHRMLLTSFGMFQHRQDDSEWKMVWAGSGEGAELRGAARRMGLEARLVFVPDPSGPERSALLQGCGAVVHPALEAEAEDGLTHALQFCKPVLCSDAPCLPEPVRDAAVVFDPRKAREIADALGRVANDERLLESLSQRSRHQASELGSARDAARRLIDVLEGTLRASSAVTSRVEGVQPDGWTDQRIMVTWCQAKERRFVRLTLQAPDWLPWRNQRIHLMAGRHHDAKTYRLRRGRVVRLKIPVPQNSGRMELMIEPLVTPKACGVGNDSRELGCICWDCVVEGEGRREALFVRGRVAKRQGDKETRRQGDKETR